VQLILRCSVTPSPHGIQPWSREVFDGPSVVHGWQPCYKERIAAQTGEHPAWNLLAGGETAMQYGLLMMPVHPPEKPLAQAFDEDIDLPSKRGGGV
jgi:hypothetical protein